MKALFFLMALCAISHAKTPLQIVHEVERELVNDDSSKARTKFLINQGMNGAIERAVYYLNERGYFQLAEQTRRGWVDTYGRDMFSPRADIGSHDGIVAWINTTYRMIEMALGREFCVTSHISAMLTFNSANVAIRPCTFPMDGVPGERIDEVRRHLAGKSPVSDSNYYGIIPEIVFFAVQIGCTAATGGAGFALCSLSANSSSRMIATFVAPKLSDRIYKRACEGKDVGGF